MDIFVELLFIQIELCVCAAVSQLILLLRNLWHHLQLFWGGFQSNLIPQNFMHCHVCSKSLLVRKVAKHSWKNNAAEIVLALPLEQSWCRILCNWVRPWIRWNLEICVDNFFATFAGICRWSDDKLYTWMFSALKKEATRQVSLPVTIGQELKTVESDFDAVCSRARVAKTSHTLEDGSPPVRPVRFVFKLVASHVQVHACDLKILRRVPFINILLFSVFWSKQVCFPFEREWMNGWVRAAGKYSLAQDMGKERRPTRGLCHHASPRAGCLFLALTRKASSTWRSKTLSSCLGWR